MFERYVSIDWSGSGKEKKPIPGLAVAQADPRDGEARIERPSDAGGKKKNWSRERLVDWLTEEVLREGQPRCIIAMDFGFGYPWGTDGAVFGVEGWRAMLREIGRLYGEEETARAVAKRINGWPRFNGNGPYRFADRSNFRFYRDKGIAYYRLVELVVPEAISQWRLGAGAAVGFSTITGLAAIDTLASRRAEGKIDFRVWPQELDRPAGDEHVLVESYPAIFPNPANGPWKTNDERDAWKVLLWMRDADKTGALSRAFELLPLPFGRIEGIDFEEQIRSEGWILGVV